MQRTLIKMHYQINQSTIQRITDQKITNEVVLKSTGYLTNMTRAPLAVDHRRADQGHV
jgi:hypothetical protein